MGFINSSNFAQDLDKHDPLGHFRLDFHIPQHKNQDVVYFTGNSLGLQPRSTREYLEIELRDWSELGVKGHFHGKNPWFGYHKGLMNPLANLVGSKTSEVVPMGNLTANLHHLMTTFYRPDPKRNKIMIEAGAFPSDHYAVESQLLLHGLDPKKHIIEVTPQSEQEWLRTEDIINQIEEHGNELALILFGGVQYYTGQFFDLRRITEVGQASGAKVGFDLAHAIGNIPMELHQWNVDFAVWCTYKYLNSGPGATAGLFVHQNHHTNKKLVRMAGWWGHDEEIRFNMQPGFLPIPTAEGWQQSNANVISMACQKASLELFEQAGIKNLRAKSIKLTSFLEFVLNDLGRQDLFRIITPPNPDERGCQLSLFFNRSGREIFDLISKQDVVADWREPNVIRIAPVPFYNSFSDVYRFGKILNSALSSLDV